MIGLVKEDLLQRFTDKGDDILGRALETNAGRSLYDRVRGHVLGGGELTAIYSYFTYLDTGRPNVRSLGLVNNDVRILVLKMMEKAVADLIRKLLKPTE